MARKEAKKLKALYFDLRIKDLEKHYSKSNLKGAYAKIKRFMIKHNFSHIQYSGYHSNYKTTELEIFDLIYEMSNKFEVTNIGANHDLLEPFNEEIDDPLYKYFITYPVLFSSGFCYAYGRKGENA